MAIITLVGGGIMGTGLVMAQNTNQNQMSSLVQEIAQKFNLNQADVQAVFDQNKTEHQQQMQQNMQQMEDKRLGDLVTQGKITADQKTAIENELSSLKTKYNLGTKNNETMAQRKQDLQNFQNDWQAWLKSQNIDPAVIKPMGGMGMGMGRRGMGNWHKPTPTSSPAT